MARYVETLVEIVDIGIVFRGTKNEKVQISLAELEDQPGLLHAHYRFAIQIPPTAFTPPSKERIDSFKGKRLRFVLED